MDKATKFYLPRTCVRADAQGRSISEPLEASRDLPAYVLLGEPGSGKTRAFEREAEACGGEYVKARNFALLKKTEVASKIVFIDGLDERRALGGSGHTPLDYIREHLDRLGRPRFRLSCREADWLGDSDRDALAFVAPTGSSIVALHLEPLSDENVLALLANEQVANPREFLDKARKHQLDPLLRNPQVLKLLAKAVGDGVWPDSKGQIFERACRELARELNIEHQTGAPGPRPSIDQLLEAAGYLCAILLLSGEEGLTRFDLSDSAEIVPLGELMAPSDLPLDQASGTNLFRAATETSRTYLHRSVAEFLGATYLARRIGDHGLPVERILATCTGEDGGVALDLRGLCAWLAAYSPAARLALIERDPLGVVLYGDVSVLTADDKHRIFAALKREANRYPGFRAGDWTSEPFGALSTRDMRETIESLLAAPAATDGDQAFQDCVMDAVKHGEPMPTLEPLLEQIARNGNYWPTVRASAMEAIERVNPSPGNGLSRLLDDIHNGVVEDRDDELMGFLLHHLYKRGMLSASQIFDYLHAPKQENLIGDYRQFWSPDLVIMAPESDLPVLLDELAKRHKTLESVLESYIGESLPGELLARTLEVHGDSASDEQLYTWLAAGHDKWHHPRLDEDDKKRVSDWISARPDRYKMIADRPVQDCQGSNDVSACLVQIRPRLFHATPPEDIIEWYLTKASRESQPDISEYYFHQAVVKLHQRDKSAVLSDASLDLLDNWVKTCPKFEPWREEATSSRLNDWKREEAQRQKKYEAEQSEHKREILSHFQEYLPQIREGTAPHHVMFELSQAYDGRRIEGRGDTPMERLSDFFDGNAALIDATLTGMPNVLERADLPTVDEIIALELKGKFHLIREAALLGMAMRYESDREVALSLPKTTLEKLCAFWLAKGTSEDPDWFEALARVRPGVVAKVVIAYTQRAIKAKREYVAGIWQLGHSPEFAAVATLALPPLLEAFPVRCQIKQLERCLDPLLRGALSHMARADLAEIVARKLKRATLDAPQRVYWLACGMLIDAPRYTQDLIDFVRESRSRRSYLAAFLSSQSPQRTPPVEELPDSALAQLIELLGPEAPAGLATGLRRRVGGENLGAFVRFLVRTLERRSSEVALQALARMLENHSLEPWHNFVRAALNTVRVSRRKASLPQLTPRQASQVIANNKPANAGDLAAIVVGHLRDIARKIRDGATNDYKQYWNLGPEPAPRIENDCRDTLLSQLEERLSRYGGIGIPAMKEGHVANEQRVDVMVSYGGAHGFAVPLEIKRENYRKDSETIWTALRTQLIDRYAHFPTARGHGIYVVFWFGGKTLPPSPTGIAPKTPLELEAQLRALLAPEDSRIEIVVMDCSMPTKLGASIPKGIADH